MLRVTIELMPHGDEARARVLHRGFIANDGIRSRETEFDGVHRSITELPASVAVGPIASEASPEFGPSGRPVLPLARLQGFHPVGSTPRGLPR